MAKKIFRPSYDSIVSNSARRTNPTIVDGFTERTLSRATAAVIQQTTQAGLFLDRPGGVTSSFHDGFVVQTLMRSFFMVMGQVFAEQNFQPELSDSVFEQCS